MVFARFIPIIEVLTLLGLFCYLTQLGSYHSMERVIVFRLVYKILKKIPNLRSRIEITFILTIILSLLLGHLTSNPLSFIYSIIFWGTVLIFRENKIKMAFLLNCTLFYISSFSGSSHSPLSILINPIITAVMSTAFPFYFLNTLLPEYFQFNGILNGFTDLFLNMISFLDRIDPFPNISFSTWKLLVAFVFLYFRKFKTFFLILCFTIQTLNPPIPFKLHSHIFPLGDAREVMKVKAGWVSFIDRKCQLIDTQIFCKKKPSAWGGPIL